MAGLDYLVDDAPSSWLEQEKSAADHSSQVSPNRAAEAREARPKTAPTPAQPVQPEKWPQTIEQFCAAIEQGQALPGTQLGGGCAKPFGRADADMMIISDIPDFDEIEAGSLGQGQSGKLLANMAAAIGYDLADCFLTALATSRPASGDLPEEAIGELTAFMKHQIGLVQPKIVLILGSAACSALLDAELMSARGNLLFVKHNGQKVVAVTSFHPRTLIARPVLKAQSWKDLQIILINKGLP